jgi:acyl carrier protein
VVQNMIDLFVSCFEDVFRDTTEAPVDADTDFFRDLGGDSLAALELSVLVEERSGLTLVDEIFQASTPRALAGLVATAGRQPPGSANARPGVD